MRWIFHRWSETDGFMAPWRSEHFIQRQPSNWWKMVILLRTSESLMRTTTSCPSMAVNRNAIWTLCSLQYHGCFSCPIFTRSANADGSRAAHLMEECAFCSEVIIHIRARHPRLESFRIHLQSLLITGFALLVRTAPPLENVLYSY